MSADTNDSDGGRMAKLDVRVPQELLDAIESEYEERGYASRSEAVRDALRTWVDPPVRLSQDTLEELTVSREQREAGDTHGSEDVRRHLGLDVEK